MIKKDEKMKSYRYGREVEDSIKDNKNEVLNHWLKYSRNFSN